MAWSNPPVALYHGTKTYALRSSWTSGNPLTLGQKLAFAIDWNRCRQGTDFSRGFYTTTSRHQASQWANNSVRSLQKQAGAWAADAVLLRFEVDRDQLALLDVLAFVRDSADYYEFVRFCRGQKWGPADAPPTHGRAAPKPAYDVVLGPVTVGRQNLIIQGGDQVSFHSDAAFHCLCGVGAEVNDLAAPGTRFLP
jgi:Protein of unknown function (DUF3990)